MRYFWLKQTDWDRQPLKDAQHILQHRHKVHDIAGILEPRFFASFYQFSLLYKLILERMQAYIELKLKHYLQIIPSPREILTQCIQIGCGYIRCWNFLVQYSCHMFFYKEKYSSCLLKVLCSCLNTSIGIFLACGHLRHHCCDIPSDTHQFKVTGTQLDFCFTEKYFVSLAIVLCLYYLDPELMNPLFDVKGSFQVNLTAQSASVNGILPEILTS